MAEPYKDRIVAYRMDVGVRIPSGFHRHSANRYAAVDLEQIPPKLIAKTWFNREDVAYYLSNLETGRPMRVLDFKDRCDLVFNGVSFTAGSDF
ncbi:hypothetical protein AE921_16915 [Xanthomonas arboricola]|uniref:hypothetical protein n=1 Tax=Xanthomonas arboricola TaxID=56448 RepID=UPI00069FC257|nr:hypothetical protein [Xanthomonas arboricola]KOA97641.1 hypothetical protein AE921_16915 [Xanthomonas arboricola]KOB34162.1 hypothetical protein AE928_00915 [Xanthomonas arboricola]KOB44905.1 hypothetical protein AE931_07310 [Xanthomonas arboricola]NIK51697.1 hypothetical protein [Xanthomonas arboricola]